MALSSNWLNLQKEKKVKVSKKKNTNNIIKKNHTNHKNESNKSKPKSRIMTMVYAMNDEIAKQELNKKDGKEFVFKTKNTDKDNNVELVNAVENEINNVKSKKATDIGKYVAIDCEFVGTGPEGKEHSLARISMTNYFGHVIMDDFVKPRDKVRDWRTEVSGVKPEHMKNAIPFKVAQKKCADVIKGRILVGHALKHDLEALLLSHPKSMVRDTARHLPFRNKYAMGKTPSLKKLTKEVLNFQIQSGEHSSVEDARATMLLYKSDKLEFERLHKAKFGF